MKSTLLLIDIGNTRTKWCLLNPLLNDWDFEKFYGVMSNSESPFSQMGNHTLQAIIDEREHIQQIIICNVAQDSVGHLWRQWLMMHLPQTSINEFTSSLTFSKVENHYLAPYDLGNDRWAAIIGGFYFAPQGNYLVVSSGTATTIDYINEELAFEGGLILPGINLMLHALGSKTALLPNLSYQSPQVIPNYSLGHSTDSAILQGVLYSQLGAIQLTLDLNPQIRFLIVSGGNASLLYQHLEAKTNQNLKVILDPFVVFRGLSLWFKDRQES